MDRERQQGFALLVLIGIVGLAAITLLVGKLQGAQSSLDREQITRAALARAKEALIARAVAHDDRPGSMPCPALDANGTVPIFVGSDCPSYIGRLPWRTLGLSDLRDGYGEQLWFALSRSLRDNPVAEPINSATTGQLTLGPTTEIAVVIIAPGPPLAGQGGRPSNNQTDYLDGANADGDTVYADGPSGAGFNDRVVAITRDELMRAVEKRVANEVRAMLEDFYLRSAVNPSLRHFPYAAIPGGDGAPVNGLRQGSLPKACTCAKIPFSSEYRCNCSAGVDFFELANFEFDDKSGSCELYPDSDNGPNCRCTGSGTCRGHRQSGGSPASFRSSTTLDSLTIDATGASTPWFDANQWRGFIYYALAGGCTSATPGCTSLPFLSLDAASAHALVFGSGRALGGQDRTSPPATDAADYLEDPENTDGDDVFVRPTSNDYAVALPRS